MNDDAVGELGTLERVGDVSVLRYERRLAHPVERVWRALTDEADLAAWFPTTIEGERRDGAPLRFSFRRGEGAPFDGEMLACVPPSLLELRWSDDVLRFELEPDAAGCILRLRVTFPEHGKAARDGAGWHVCVEALATLCDGTPPPNDPGGPGGGGGRGGPSGRWQVVHRAYVERFGPEASTVGPPG